MTTPLVFVHGLRMSGACWDDQRCRFPDHPTSAPDLPGHGSRRGERFDMDSGVDAVLDAVLRACDGRGGKAFLIAHSLGGFVAMANAAARPEMVAGLLLAGSTVAPTRLLCTPYRVMHRALSGLPDGGDAASARLFRQVLPDSVAAPLVAGGIATEAIPDVMAALERSHPLRDLDRYPGPVVFVNGRHDHFRLGERRFVTGANRSLTIINRAGHYAPFNHGAAFGQIVRRSLDRAAKYSGRSEIG